MHELSIVMAIVDMAEREFRKNRARRIESIELDIGTLSGIELKALEFAWPVGVKDSVLQDAHRQINLIEAEARCLECDRQFGLENRYDPCPGCGGHFLEFLRGEELRVKSLTIN